MEYLPSGWHLWLLASVGAGLLEIKLGNFVFVWFALGGLVAAALSAVGVPLEAQLVSFGIVSSALFFASRTIFKHALMRNASRLSTGAEGMLGKEARVTEALNGRDGAVRIHGELWSARSLEGAVPVGEVVQVERIEGLTLYVRRPRLSLWDENRKEA